MNNSIKTVAPDQITPHQSEATILIPWNGSERKADYILALATDLGAMDIRFPAAVRHSGVNYPFDFYCFTEDACVVKVLRDLNDDAIEQVEALSDVVDIIVIVDEKAIACKSCLECEKYAFCKDAVSLASRLDAYIYSEGALYEYNPETRKWNGAIPE